METRENTSIFAQLQGAKSHTELANGLRALKNGIVGHRQKKEEWVRLGALEYVARALRLSSPSGKLNGGATRIQLVPRRLSDENDTKLQALQLIGSFACGGAEFLGPLHANQVLPDVLASINPYVIPSQIVIAALRALTEMADASALTKFPGEHDVQSLADQVFTQPHLHSLNAILSLTTSGHSAQTQVSLAADLIGRLCVEERHQHALAISGILDTLAARLAGVAVAQEMIIPKARMSAQRDGLLDAFPGPAPPNMKLEAILRAISAIIGDSKYHANRFIHAPAIMAVFPSVRFDPPKLPWRDNRLELNYPLTAMEYVLPFISPTASSRSSTSPSVLASDRGDSHTLAESPTGESRQPSAGRPSNECDSEVECPVIPWLIHLAKTQGGHKRLMAASVLSSLYRAGLGLKGYRERSIAFLVVPLIVDMMIKADEDTPADALPSESRRMVAETAPMILAHLITDNESLQKAAFDCDAVKVLIKMLRRSYTPVQSAGGAPWRDGGPGNILEMGEKPATAQLGEKGEDALLVHRIRTREAVLKAIGAIASGSEDYRKVLVTADDFVSLVVESLSEFPGKPRMGKDHSREKPTSAHPGYGRNPNSLIIAACHLVRVLSRSVAILRTAIVDHDVALPIFDIMKHANVEMQIAATSTMVNLVMDASPVREMLAEKGVMSVLCEHVHADNASLRLNALWALKHFVHAVPLEVKKACLEELGPGWLVQLISDDSTETTANSRRRADSGDEIDEDVKPSITTKEAHRWIIAVNGATKELDASKLEKLSQAEKRLAAIRALELDPRRRARHDDLAIQEQGLEFIRNFIGLPGQNAMADSQPEVTRLVDHLFNELGQERLFGILTSKLSARVLNPFSRRASTPGRETMLIYPQPQLIIPVIYILVHMAASDSRHRQLVIAQTELLRLLVSYTNSKEREVRLALCHLIVNLLWSDEPSERASNMQRAQELKRLGFQHKMDTLTKGDVDLNVRERAKHAAWSMENALY